MSKTLIISDCHISNGATYSWFHAEEQSLLTGWVAAATNDAEVSEIVLLGDFFDLWLYPINQTPWPVAQIVTKNPDAAAVVAALGCIVYEVVNRPDQRRTAVAVDNAGREVWRRGFGRDGPPPAASGRTTAAPSPSYLTIRPCTLAVARNGVFRGVVIYCALSKEAELRVGVTGWVLRDRCA
jgi:hypothetical protein